MKIEVTYQSEVNSDLCEVFENVKLFSSDGQIIVISLEDGSQEIVYFEDVVKIGLSNK